MPVSPAPLILGGVAILALLATAGAGGKTRPKRDPILDPVPVPETDEDLELVDQTICDCWDALAHTDQAVALQACAAETLHPDIPWPPIADDHSTVHALWELFGERSKALVALADPAAFCQGLDPVDPNILVEEWFSDEPTPGKFYVIGSDPELTGSDSFSRIARRALNSVIEGMGDNANNGGQRRLQYIHCVTSGPRWNWPLYASTSFSENYPKYFGVNGKGLRRAFFPWHEAGKKGIFERRFPKKAITNAGAKIVNVGNSWGTLWLPPVDAEALANNVVTCGFQEWSDGSSSIDPPPEVLNVLAGVPQG